MLDLSVAFTASRDLDTAGEEIITSVLTTGIPLCRQYITGGARGGDAFIGRWLAREYPTAEHIVILPANRKQVDPWWLEPVLRCAVFVDIVEMPLGTTFKDRNAELVRRGDAMVGFPAYPEEHPSSLRSGTWQTIRMSRRAGKLCRWDLVKPPYTGRIEKPLGEFAAELSDKARREERP